MMDEVVVEELRPRSELPTVGMFRHRQSEVAEAPRRFVAPGDAEEQAVRCERKRRRGGAPTVECDAEASERQQWPKIRFNPVGRCEHLCEELLNCERLDIGRFRERKQLLVGSTAYPPADSRESREEVP